MVKRPSTPAESLVERIDRTEPGHPGQDTIPSGFPSIDKMLGGGFRRRDLVILAGDVGSGKSSLALGIALRSALLGTPTMYFSGEMSEERLMERALAVEGKATIDEIRAGTLSDPTRASVGAAAIRLRGLPLVIRGLHGQNFEELNSGIRMVPRPGLVVIDPVQMVEPPRPASTSDETLGLAARSLKSLALDHDVVVLALAQVSINPGKREDPRPTLEDLGGQGALKQHADLVLGIYREEMYRPGGGMEGATELIVAKNRNGPTGFVDLYFYRRWLRFEDMLDPEA